ncbi:integrase core domain-containing protein, partial [Chitinophaga eiseniae]
DPYENALAERMNKTIKEEFFPDRPFKSKELAIKATAQAVTLYNQYRPHLALKLKTPGQVHEQKIPVI